MEAIAWASTPGAQVVAFHQHGLHPTGKCLLVAGDLIIILIFVNTNRAMLSLTRSIYTETRNVGQCPA